MSDAGVTPSGSRDDNPRLPDDVASGTSERSAAQPDGHLSAAAGADVPSDVTPAEEQAIERRERRYLWVMIPCIVLLLVGFFVPMPTPMRVLVLAVAAGLPLVGVFVGNVGRN